MALALGDFTVAGGGSSGGVGVVVWIKDKKMNQPLLPSKLMGQALPEQVITILRGSVHLCVSDIIRLEAERNYTRFVLADGRKLLTSKNISFYEPLLPALFLRVNKSCLLNRIYISILNKHTAHMLDGFVAQVSRRKRSKIK